MTPLNKGTIIQLYFYKKSLCQLSKKRYWIQTHFPYNVSRTYRTILSFISNRVLTANFLSLIFNLNCCCASYLLLIQLLSAKYHWFLNKEGLSPISVWHISLAKYHTYINLNGSDCFIESLHLLVCFIHIFTSCKLHGGLSDSNRFESITSGKKIFFGYNAATVQITGKKKIQRL